MLDTTDPSVIQKLHERSYRMVDKKGIEKIRNVEWLKPFVSKGGYEDYNCGYVTQ